MIDQLFELIKENPGTMLPIILGIPGMFCAVAAVWVICASSVKVAREKEKARREVAAYVAEGSITAEDAERLLQPSPWYFRGDRNPEKWAENAGRCWGKAKQAARDAAGGEPKQA